MSWFRVFASASALVLGVAACGSARGGGKRSQPPPGDVDVSAAAAAQVDPQAPKPVLGATTTAAAGDPPCVLGLSADEAKRVNAAPAGSRLSKLKALAIRAAKLDLQPLTVQPNRHLVNRKMSEKVPGDQALDLGFLIEWNETMDALGVAYALTNDARYSAAVSQQLLPWMQYSPPNGEGGEKGGEPSVYHRNFVGTFRAIDHCWSALTPQAKQAAVHLATTIADRLDDWWTHTPWERGNHAAATAQTGIYASLVLLHAATADPKLASADDAKRRLDRFLNAGEDLPQDCLLGGDKRQPGLIGFGPQVLIGIETPQNFAVYRQREKNAPQSFGASMDFFYKPPNRRFDYHALLTHHMLTSYWAIVRNGCDRATLHHPKEVREAIGMLLDFTRPYLERGELLAGAKGDAPDPKTSAPTREVIGMAARLFPEKKWLEPLRQRGDPVEFTEIYSEVAQFQ